MQSFSHTVLCDSTCGHLLSEMLYFRLCLFNPPPPKVPDVLIGLKQWDAKQLHILSTRSPTQNQWASIMQMCFMVTSISISMGL